MGAVIVCLGYPPGENKAKSNSIQSYTKRMSKKAGFTLVEVMIAVGIIAILAAMIIPNINQGSAQARDAERKATLVTLQGALELYKNKYGRYPAGCNDNSGTTNQNWSGHWSGEPGSDWSCPGDSAEYIIDLAPEFIPVLPRDPLPEDFDSDGDSDRSYVYTTNPDGTVYKLMSMNGAEEDFVPSDYLHPFARCGNLFDGGNECSHVLDSPLGGGYSYNVSGIQPSQCRNNHSQFETTYAVWGGYAPGGNWNNDTNYRDNEKAREYFSDQIRCK